ncbi:hypothetical protein MKW98_027697 [Papaver atlanticum]|uniref:Uncharacterized protein n=1 Tax=Papaver atlanticum TaxID=357466 RepID=A0AAD4TBT6_9MAGN|nr:hypothetical protein MKW98_027697 [Papaver atlanticum]
MGVEENSRPALLHLIRKRLKSKLLNLLWNQNRVLIMMRRKWWRGMMKRWCWHSWTWRFPVGIGGGVTCWTGGAIGVGGCLFALLCCVGVEHEEECEQKQVKLGMQSLTALEDVKSILLRTNKGQESRFRLLLTRKHIVKREWDQPPLELRLAVSVHVKMDVRDIPNTEAGVVIPNDSFFFFTFLFSLCFPA